MLAAKTTLSNSSVTSIHLALFLGVNMLVTPSSSMSGRGAPFPGAEPVATVRFAETTTNNTRTATVRRAFSPGAVLLAESFSTCVAAAACSRALHFG